MLVDPDSDSGIVFIRDWGKDSNKKVLSYTWVRKSITAGKPLLEEDQWGGCLAQDNGHAIDNGNEDGDDDDEIATKSVQFSSSLRIKVSASVNKKSFANTSRNTR